MQTSQSVGIASTEGLAEGANVVAMFSSAKRRVTSGSPTSADSTRSFLTFGSLKYVHSDSGLTVTQQLSPWNLCSPGSALLQAVQDVHGTPDTPTSGVPVILVFATPSWRLLIASRSSELPAPWAGDAFVSREPATVRILSAKLLAQPALSAEGCSTALRAWRAVAPEADVEATSLFVSTVLEL